jgi:hypothetical protein
VDLGAYKSLYLLASIHALAGTQSCILTDVEPVSRTNTSYSPCRTVDKDQVFYGQQDTFNFFAFLFVR